MALIGKIRNNMWFVIILLAIALAGFIIMDMTSASNKGGFGSQTTIGKIADQKIDYMDFQRAESALYSGSTDIYGRRNSLWNYFLESAIIDKITETTGLGVGVDELNELEFGINLSPIVESFYRNPQTGQVDRTQLNDIKKAIDEGTVTNPEFAAKFNELRKQVVKTQKQVKLSNIVSKAIYTPTWLAETMDKINNETASLEFVKIPFDVIEDAEVTLTDEDYNAFIKKNENKYTNKEEVRNVSYIVFDVMATLEDSTNLREGVLALKEDFGKATNDSLFTSNNNGFYNTFYAKKDEVTGPLKDTITSLPVGYVYGPYIDNNLYILAKLVGKKVIADSAKAAHIHRSVEGGDPVQILTAKLYIDSLKNAITSGKTTFSDAALSNSQDQGTAANGGDMGTFVPGAMVPEINDAVFNGTEGELYTVTSSFGVHLIKVNKLIYTTKEIKYNLAYITQAIIASEATQNVQLDMIMNLMETSRKIEDLEKIAVDGVKIESAGSLKKNDFTFSDLGSNQTSRDIIKWAFDDNTNVGDVSSTAYTYTDDVNYVDSKYVIAGLKSINKAGLATLESIKKAIEPLVKNEKKAEKIKSKISGTDLNAIATIFTQTTGLAENINFGTGSLPEAGSEPLVIGKAFSLAAGAVSAPIVGNGGVYMVKMISKTPAVAEGGSFFQKMQLTQNARGQVNFRLMEALKKLNKVDDNRFTFF